MWHTTSHQLSQDGQSLRVEPSDRWVRGELGGQVVVDSRRPLLLLSSRRPPTYYFPRQDLAMELLTASEKSARFPLLGETTYWHLVAGDQHREDAAFAHTQPPPPLEGLRDHLAFKWASMDHWYEEDEEIFVHPRDPFTRVDIIKSSRRVRVEIAGQVLAESEHPTLLFETGLPTRYYLEPKDVRQGLLTPTDSHTRCPYKGVASYWSVAVGGDTYPDLVWSYLDPVQESAKIKGLMCFYNERVDLILDGALQPRPLTAWS